MSSRAVVTGAALLCAALGARAEAPSSAPTRSAPAMPGSPTNQDGNVLVDLAVVPTEIVRYDVNGQQLPGGFLLGTWANLASRSFDDDRVRIVTSFRFDLDTAVTPKEEAAFQPYLQPTHYSLMAAYVEADLPKGLELRVGRQFHADPADYLAFDGGNLRWSMPFAPLDLELYGGVRTTFAIATGQVASSLYQLDGVQDETETQPLFGAVLRWRGSLIHRAQASVGFRWGFRVPGEALVLDPALPNELMTTEEILTASAGGDLGPVHLFGAAAYELVLETLNQAQAGATVPLEKVLPFVAKKRLEGDTLSLQYRRYRPVFALDSIFNYFSIQPFDEYSVAVDGWVFGRLRMDLRGFTRWFFSDTTDRGGNTLTIAPGAQSANGGQLSGVYAKGPWLADALGDFETGAQGTRLLVDGGLRRTIDDAFELFGRVSVAHFDLTQQPTQNSMSYGVVGGATWHLPAHADVSLVVEETLNPFTTAIPRVFAVADFGRWL